MKYFTKEHEWAVIEDNDVALVGITDYAVESIGDVTLVDLETVGTVLDINGRFGDVESVKAVSELYSPVSGEIVEINEDLDMQPELVNESPNEDGWMVRIKMSDASELDGLMSEEEYLSFVDSIQ